MKIVEAKSNLPFSEQALAKMLETQEELFIGYNFQDKDVLRVGNEAYADTAWYASKEGNSYFLSSWLEGDDGEGPEEGAVKEFKTIEELYAAIQNLEPLTDMPALQEAASEEKQFRSEYQKLMSTPEGREQYKALPLEQRVELMQADRAVDPVDQILSQLPDYELEYEGYDEDWYEDKWNYSIMDHDQDYGTYHFDDFTYEVDATSLFEYLVDLLQDKAQEEVTAEVMVEYKKLMQAWYDAEREEEDRACAAMELYVAQHLHELATLYKKDVTEYFKEAAYKWAGENLEPMEDWDYYNMPDRLDENLQANTAEEFKEYETMWEN